MDSMLDKIKAMEERREHLRQGWGPAAIEKQRKSGKPYVRDALDLLFDKGTFTEDGLWIRAHSKGRELPADAVITGMGRIHGRPVCIYAHDFTVLAGTWGRGSHYKIEARAMTLARELLVPCIGLVDTGAERTGGADVSSTGPGSEGSVYYVPFLHSGVVPGITIMFGPCFAGAAYSPTHASDFYIMQNKTGTMAVASPDLLRGATFAEVTAEEIGGATMHATVTGNADFLVETGEEGLAIARELITYFPLNYREDPPVVDTGDDPNRRDERLLEIVPADLSKPYDMHEVINCIVDKGSFFETGKLYAPSIMVGFGRLNGHTVGIVANNPAVDNGILTINTSDKAARFIRFCDCFNIPLLFLVDTPGFSSTAKDYYGKLLDQSPDGLLRTAPKQTFAICEATVPMVVVHIGKCFGPASLFMGNIALGVDFAFSWPCAQVARVNPEEAVESIYKEEIASSNNPDEVRREKLAELLKKYYNYPYTAAGEMMVNDLIDPRDTRPLLIKTFENLARKKPTPRLTRKHSLVPR